jgi:hypothetical protein
VLKCLLAQTLRYLRRNKPHTGSLQQISFIDVRLGGGYVKRGLYSFSIIANKVARNCILRTSVGEEWFPYINKSIDYRESYFYSMPKVSYST